MRLTTRGQGVVSAIAIITVAVLGMIFNKGDENYERGIDGEPSVIQEEGGFQYIPPMPGGAVVQNFPTQCLMECDGI
jgi:hypothetical protein